jgi:hypothetical protein
MNGELKQISLFALERLMEYHLDLKPNEYEAMMAAARISRPIYSGMFGEALVCLVGLIPPSLLSDNVYIWCYVTEEIRDHKIAFTRHARRLMAQLRQTYPVIYGHCFDETSCHWLESLGAVKTSPTTFEIVSWPHH